MKEEEPKMTFENDEMLELVYNALEAKRAGDEKSEMSFWMEASKLHLKNEFGIENLTTIEGVYLRRITEEVMKEQVIQEAKRDELLKKGDKHGAWSADLAVYEDLDDEIVERWLLELYEVTHEQIPGKIDGPFKEYIRRLREKSHLI